MTAATKTGLVLAAAILSVSLWRMFAPDADSSRLPPAQNAEPGQRSTQGADNNRSAVLVPTFHILRQKLGYPVPLIVASNTTDQQLEALLWFIREKVQQGKFRELGIIHETSPKRWGKYDYGSGMFVIYRGERCAGENFFDEFTGNGPCGYGDHNAASYQWGISYDPANDAGDITETNGQLKIIFGR